MTQVAATCERLIGSELFEAGHVASHVTDDFEALATFRPCWGPEYSQLGRGRFRGSLFAVHTSEMGLRFESWSPGVMIRGQVPEGLAAAFIPLRVAGPISNRGHRLDQDSLLIAGPGDWIDLRSVSELSALIVLLAPAALERSAQQWCGLAFDSQAGGVSAREPFTGRPALHHVDGRRLREEIRAVEAALRASSPWNLAPLRHRATACVLEEYVLRLILSGLQACRPEPHAVLVSRVALKAEQYLREHMHFAVSIRDLCVATGVTERTLHQSFREHFGITPKAYQKMLMLNAAHRALRNAPPGMRVTDIAMSFNVFHFSWFAHDYRTMFGELPSATLRNAGHDVWDGPDSLAPLSTETSPHRHPQVDLQFSDSESAKPALV